MAVVVRYGCELHADGRNGPDGLKVADSTWLWAAFTIAAAAAQTVRNAAQRELTGKLGTVGATQVRFLFGCPFAVMFLLAMLGAGGTLAYPVLSFWLWLLDG